MEVVQEFGAAAPSLDTLLTQLDDLALEETRLDKLINEINNNQEMPSIKQDAVLSATETLKDIIMTCQDPKRTRMLLQYFIEKIVIKGDLAELHYRPERLLSEKSYEPMVHSSERWLPELGSNQRPAD